MFSQTFTARKLPISPPAGTEWCRPLLMHAICSERIYHSYAARGVTTALRAFCVLGDLDL